jgi:mono/diheme cytochrome c family protein
MMKRFFIIAVVLSILTIPSRAKMLQQANNKTVWDGVYSEEQAQRGSNFYNAACSSCHRRDLSGFEGALKGQRFMDRWREDSLESLYSNISKSMPRNDPGSLNTATYLDIVSYILQQNGFPSGESELKSDSLKNIQVTGKEGPEPLPAGALVQTYGCIKEGPANAWTLANATQALRTRNPDKSSDADLKAAEAKTSGSANYRLVDATFYHPERYKDHMVEAKGFLVTDPNEGIGLTSLAPLSNTCPEHQ